MNCNEVQDLLGAYLDGGISDPATHAAISRHLKGCTRCDLEMQATAAALAQLAPLIKQAGDQITVPDARWQRTAAAVRPTARPRPLFGPNHHRRKQSRMNETPEIPRTRRISALSDVMAFAMILIVLLFAWLLFSVVRSSEPGSALSEDAAEPTATAEDSAAPEETATPIATPTPAPTPTPDVLQTLGGFTENAIDPTSLPEYEVPTGGGGGGGGSSGCPEIDVTQSVYLIDSGGDAKELCLYDLPNLAEGSRFTVTLTSSGGRQYSATFTAAADPNAPDLLTLVREASPQSAPAGYVQTGSLRTPLSLGVYFPAAQDYGTWNVEAAVEGGAPNSIFASGTIEVATQEPIYSVTHRDDPLDPFAIPVMRTYHAGDEVIFAARGLEPGRSLILGLYAPDEARTTTTTMVMTPRYGAHITVDDEGAYRVVFVVGTETPLTYFTALFDPQPDVYRPEGFGMVVGPP